MNMKHRKQQGNKLGILSIVLSCMILLFVACEGNKSDMDYGWEFGDGEESMATEELRSDENSQGTFKVGLATNGSLGTTDAKEEKPSS